MTHAHDDSGDRRLTEWAEAAADLAELLREFHQHTPPAARTLTLAPPPRPTRTAAAWAAAYCTLAVAALIAPLAVRVISGVISNGLAIGWDIDWPGTA